MANTMPCCSLVFAMISVCSCRNSLIWHSFNLDYHIILHIICTYFWKKIGDKSECILCMGTNFLHFLVKHYSLAKTTAQRFRPVH